MKTKKEFKIGKKVICIDQIDELENDNIYVILGIKDHYRYVQVGHPGGDTIPNWHWASRFNLYENEKRFNIGDEVRIKSDLIVGRIYGNIEALEAMEGGFGRKTVVKAISDKGNYWLDKPRLYFSEQMLEEVFQVKYFSGLNQEEAVQFIGKPMEFNNRAKGRWFGGILGCINYEGTFPFYAKNAVASSLFMRTCKETYTQERYPVELLEALRKSILHWQLVVESGKSKEAAYEFLGGVNTRWSCFLCDYTGYGGERTGDIPEDSSCSKCIKWEGTSGYKNCTCFSDYQTPYTRYRTAPSKENAQFMLAHLISEEKKNSGRKRNS